MTGLLGGWLAADATAFFQLLLSQPLVGGALAGAVWGDAYSGMQVGALLQLFALAGLPLGGRTPEDYASAGIVGPTIALYLRHVLTTSSFAAPLVCGTAAGLVTALVGRLLVRWLRARNIGLAHWLDDELHQGRAGAIDAAHALGVFHAFAIGAGFVLASTVALAACARSLVAFDALAVERASTLAEPALWGLGAGLAVRQLVAGGRHTRILFLAALVFWVAVRWLGR